MIVDGKKWCPTCEKDKEIANFSTRSDSKDGFCWQCRACAQAYQAKRYLETKDKIKAQVSIWRKNNKEKVNAYRKVYVAKYPEKIKEKGRRNSKVKRKRQREKILNAYGGTCVCCGETEAKFLAVDHIFSDGKEHRKEIGDFYGWLIQNNFPKDRFQLLCHNCNLAKEFYGECPHATKHREVLELELLAVA